MAEFFTYVGVRWYWKYWYYLLPIFFGNLIGANLFPLIRKSSPKFKSDNSEKEIEEEIVDKLKKELLHNDDSNSTDTPSDT